MGDICTIKYIKKSFVHSLVHKLKKCLFLENFTCSLMILSSNKHILYKKIEDEEGTFNTGYIDDNRQRDTYSWCMNYKFSSHLSVRLFSLIHLSTNKSMLHR